MKIFASTLIAAALLFGSHAAMAQPDHGDHGRSHEDRDHGHDRYRGDHDRRYDRDDHRHYDRDRDDHRYYARDRDDYRRYGRRYDHDRGYAYGYERVRFVPPGHRWERGRRYYGPSYVVRDYGHYRLRPPPRGYRWVRDRDDNDFLLVAVATGIILDIATH